MGFPSSQQTCKVAINLGAQEPLGLSLLQQEVQKITFPELQRRTQSITAAPSTFQYSDD